MPGLDARIVIVGGGPAGLSLALFLAALSPALLRQTVLLERAHYPREKVCAGAIAGHGLARLAAIDALPSVPHVDIRGLSATTRFGRVMVRGESSMGWVVRRVELDAALAAEARQRGLDLRQGAVVDGVDTDADGAALVKLRDGSVLRAEVVVGADGVGSVVRRSLGFAKGPLLARAIEIDTERAAFDGPADVLHFDLSAPSLRGYAWDFPTPLAGVTRMCRGMYELGPRTGELGDQLLRRPGSAPQLSGMRRFAERGIVLGQPLSRGNVLLIGEAAGIDPVLGEGIAQAILYGEASARYLIGKLANGPAAPRFDDFGRAMLRGRLGLDLGVRGRAFDLVYGATRPIVERAVAQSQPLARAGLAYFGGQHVSRVDLLRAALDGSAALLTTARDALSRLPARW